MRHIESVQVLLMEMLDRCSGTSDSGIKLGLGTLSSFLLVLNCADISHVQHHVWELTTRWVH